MNNFYVLEDLFKATPEQKEKKYKEWVEEPEKCDSVFINKEILKKVGVSESFTHACIHWKKTRNTKILSETIGISSKTVSAHIKKLIKFGYLQNISHTQEEIKKELEKIEKKEICEWCYETVFYLEEHHYPIPKRKNGTEVVRICPNCHRNFHRLENDKNGAYK